MTLIAAFRTRYGVAICADSQETVTHPDGAGGQSEFRQTVQKISPITVGGYRLVIAGSGDASPIEGFIVKVERRFAKDKSKPTAARALLLLESELKKFYQEDMPVGESFSLFIAASCPDAKEYKVWTSHGHILKELSNVELIGWEHPMYHVTAGRLYSPQMSLEQAVLAAVHVLVIAEESSNYVKGPFSVSLVLQDGIWSEDPKYVEDLRERLKRFDGYTNQILLACADTSIYSSVLEKAIIGFAKIAKSLHQNQIDAVIDSMRKTGFTSIDAIAKVPVGIMLEVGDSGEYVVRHDVNGIEELSRKVNEALQSASSEDTEEKEKRCPK